LTPASRAHQLLILDVCFSFSVLKAVIRERVAGSVCEMLSSLLRISVMALSHTRSPILAPRRSSVPRPNRCAPKPARIALPAAAPTFSPWLAARRCPPIHVTQWTSSRPLYFSINRCSRSTNASPPSARGVSTSRW
jgi:hypothetical protein